MDTAQPPTHGSSNVLFQMEGLELSETGFRGPYVRYALENIPDRRPLRLPVFAGHTPEIIRKLCLAALYDVESNIQYEGDSRYFTAGGRGHGWSGMLFIRDITFSGLLGLNRWYPEVMKDSFALMRSKMLEIGTKNPSCHRMDGYPTFEVLPLNFQGFKETYHTPPFARWTDGINALWGMQHLLELEGASPDAYREVYEFGQEVYRTCFAPLYDESDGLYRGQASFIDIGHTGYPASFGRSRPHDEAFDNPAVYNRCLRIKATSTNCLYVAAFASMASMAVKLGLDEEAATWRDQRDRLIAAILSELRFDDGTLSYFKHTDGRLEPRQHALGTAFAVLTGTLEGRDAVRAIRDYPVLPFGVPLHHPFFDNDEAYHNNAAWPFVDNFFLMARERASGEDESMRRIALLAGAFQHGSFHEHTCFKPGEATLGGPAQLWSAAPMLHAAVRAGFVCLEAPPTRT